MGATLTVTGCTLKDNAAIGAAGGDGMTNFGSGQGGGINSIGTLTVRDSTLTNNLAEGAPLAADVVPSQSVLSNSATAGGGIFCLDLAGGSVLVADSTLTGNQAVGGSGPAPALAEGGGLSLVLVPSGLVTGCTVVNNVARGGAGNAGVAGADGVSGGIDMAAGSVVTVSNSILIDNQAIGGAGGAGANGGAGVGGGVNVGTGAILFGADNCSLKLTDSTLIGNVAQGGAGGAGANGGDGWGGGLSALAGNSASIDATLIVANFALAGSPAREVPVAMESVAASTLTQALSRRSAHQSRSISTLLPPVLTTFMASKKAVGAQLFGLRSRSMPKLKSSV